MYVFLIVGSHVQRFEAFDLLSFQFGPSRQGYTNILRLKTLFYVMYCFVTVCLCSIHRDLVAASGRLVGVFGSSSCVAWCVLLYFLHNQFSF